MTALLRGVLWFLAPLGALVALLLAATFLVRPPGPAPVAGVRNADLHELPGSDAEPWSIVLLSDVQNGAAYLPEIFERAKAHAPKAILVTGDFSSNYPEHYARIPVWFLRRSPPPVPMFIAPGNHDISRARKDVAAGEGGREFARWYGATSFEFRIGNTWFLGLDNSIGPVTGPALADLKSKLEAAKSRGERTILCLHRDLISFAVQPNPRAESEHHELLSLIRDYDVPYVFCGHLHAEAYEVRGKTRFVAVPASGNRPANDANQKPVHFLVLRGTGSSFHIVREEFYRRNSTELLGVFVYMSLAKVRPIFERSPAAGAALLAGCLLPAAALAGIVLRRRRSTP